MIVVVCLDDRNGMLFNHRRQSRDRMLIADLLQLRAGHPLRMNAYSAPMFSHDDILAAEDFLSRAESGDYCFVEDQPLSQYADRIEGLVLYRWNRAYPADLHFDLELSAFQLTELTDFQGSSHDKITREIYQRK